MNRYITTAVLLPSSRTHDRSGNHYEHHLFFTPRSTLVCERALKVRSARCPCISYHCILIGLRNRPPLHHEQNTGVYGNVTIGEFHLNLVPLDSDVMSMEFPVSFKDCNLHGDHTSLFYAAHAVMQLQVRCRCVHSPVPLSVCPSPSDLVTTSWTAIVRNHSKDKWQRRGRPGTCLCRS